MFGEYLQVGYKVVYPKASGFRFQVIGIDLPTPPDWFSINR